MAQSKFSIEELSKFSHKIETCLENNDCKEIFKSFLQSTRNKNLQRAFQLWEKAYNDIIQLNEFEEDEYMDIIERIDDFNPNPLLTINENKDKLIFIRMECSRILQKVHPRFIQYLSDKHRK